MRAIICWLIFFFGLVGLVTSAPCAEIISPNREYKAVSDDNGDSISVFEVASNRLMVKMGTLGVLKMEWAKNSTMLIVSDPLAGGSEAEVLTLNDSQWVQRDYNPESLLVGATQKDAEYGVIEIIDKGNTLHIKYLVHRRRRDTSIEYNIIEFDVVPPSEKILNVKKRQISEEEGDKIRTVGE